MHVLVFVNLFLAGLLAGMEVVVRFGVRGPLTELGQVPQIQVRQGLIRTLRVLVPSVYVPTLITGVLVAVLEGAAPGMVLRIVGVAALLVWTVTTFAGTVPINSALAEWQPTAPPPGWEATIVRWHRLDTVRTWAAVTASVAFLAATAVLTA